MELKIFYGMILAFISVSALTLGAFWMISNSSLVDSYLSSNERDTPATQSPTQSDAAEQSHTTSPSPQVLGSSTDQDFTTDKLYSLINAYRRERNLGLLRAHVLLEQSASLKLADMNNRKYWTHLDPQGRSSWYLFEQVGYTYERAGENLSFGHNSAWKVFTAWQASTDHNTELLDPTYEHMGIAIDCRNYTEGSTTSCAVVLHLGSQLQ